MDESAETPMSSSGVSELRIAILAFPYSERSLDHLVGKFVEVAHALLRSVVLVGGQITYRAPGNWKVHVVDIGIRVHYLREIRPRALSFALWLVKALLAELKMAWAVLAQRSNVDIVFCTFGVYYLLPILVARLLGKKVISASLGLDSLSVKHIYGDIVAGAVSLLARLNFALSHRIVVPSLRIAAHKDLRPFRSKIHHGALFLGDVRSFKQVIPFQSRRETIGFIGRLSAEKGVMEFVRAMPLTLEHRPGLKFLIIGGGALEEEVARELHDKSWASAVDWIRWVDHSEIPAHLNTLRLVVIPSESEGLPNLALEAMACGTPVLASPVGGLPDIVKDEQTGFLLEGKSSVAIANGVIRALNHPRLADIAANARVFVQQGYSFQAAVERYRRLFEELT